MRRRKPDVDVQVQPTVRPYYALTTSPEEVAEGLRLDAALERARAGLADLEAQRSAVDDALAVLAADADLRRERAAELASQRDQAAARADLGAVAEASRFIDAVDRVDEAQEAIADQRRAEAADLDERLAAACGAVADAESAVADHRGRMGDRVPRFLVDYHLRKQLRRYLETGDDPNDTGDSVQLTLAFAEMPDAVAEAVHEAPRTYAELMNDDLRPKPKPKPTFEEATAMVEEGKRLLREYAAERDAYWEAVRARPLGSPVQGEGSN